MLRVERSGRVIGVDAARGIALIGMAAVHIFPSFGPDGSLHPSYDIAAGRAAALFALLAGVGLALANGGPRPRRGRELWAGRAGAVARAVLLLGLGVWLSGIDSPPLVILSYYALLFAVATVFLGWSHRALALGAAVAAVATPVASHLLRQEVDPAPVAEPGGADLPVELFLTGTYPVLTWTTYLLAGLAVGRSDLRRIGTAVRLVVVGAVLAIGAKLASSALLERLGGVGQLRGVDDPGAAVERGLFGTTPRGDADWLAVAAPHSGTTFDLAHTIGTSFLVLGICLLVTRVLGRALLPLMAVGSMTLTLYTAHVLSLADGSPLLLDEPRTLWLLQVLVALVLATLWRSAIGRGPLEALAALVDRSARAVVRGEGRVPVRR